MTTGTPRRAALRSGTLTLAGLSILYRAPAAAQQMTAPLFNPARFLAFAASSAEFQRRAAAVASSRDSRPEVKAFAAAMLRFREEQIGRLRSAAEGTDVRVPPPALEPEHRVVIENLEPLDYLALSRRYMEVQIQALEQEERGYQAAIRDGQGAVKHLADTTIPEIQRWREEAQRAWAAVAP